MKLWKVDFTCEYLQLRRKDIQYIAKIKMWQMLKICMANWNTKSILQQTLCNVFLNLKVGTKGKQINEPKQNFCHKLKKSSNHIIAKSLETHYILYYIFTVHQLYGADIIIMQ